MSSLLILTSITDPSLKSLLSNSLECNNPDMPDSISTNTPYSFIDVILPETVQGILYLSSILSQGSALKI